MILPFEYQHTGNQDVELLQQNMKKFVKPLEDCPLLDGILLENVDLANAVNTVINHKLGRQPRGWIVVDHAGTGTLIYRIAWNSSTLTLLAAAACTVSLWVF